MVTPIRVTLKRELGSRKARGCVAAPLVQGVFTSLEGCCKPPAHKGRTERPAAPRSARRPHTRASACPRPPQPGELCRAVPRGPQEAVPARAAGDGTRARRAPHNYGVTHRTSRPCPTCSAPARSHAAPPRAVARCLPFSRAVSPHPRSRAAVALCVPLLRGVTPHGTALRGSRIPTLPRAVVPCLRLPRAVASRPPPCAGSRIPPLPHAGALCAPLPHAVALCAPLPRAVALFPLPRGVMPHASAFGGQSYTVVPAGRRASSVP